jgi:hypothetical protein
LPDRSRPVAATAIRGMVNLGGAKLGNVLSSEDTAKYWAELLGGHGPAGDRDGLITIHRGSNSVVVRQIRLTALVW